MKVYQQFSDDEINPFNREEQHESLSKQYKFIDSNNIKEVLQDHGFILNGVSVAKSKKYQGFQKHIAVYEHPDFKFDDGNNLNLLVKNSHDGKSSLQLNLGVYRAICANGLVVGDDIAQKNITHKGDAIKKLDEGIIELIEHAPNVFGTIDSMKSQKATPEKITEMILKASELRFKDKILEIEKNNQDLEDDKKLSLRFNPESFLRARRYEDRKDDLYTVFNVIQENLIRGGLRYHTVKGERYLDARNTTREIKDANKLINFNKELWATANAVA